MNRRLPSLSAALAWACVGLSLASVAAGCHKHFLADSCDDCGGKKCGKCKKCLCDPCADVPKGAIPLPVGTYTRTHNSRMAAKAEADDFVLYWNEFQENSTKLGPFGSAERLNWLKAKKRLTNTSSQCRMVARSYSPRRSSGNPGGHAPCLASDQA